MKQNILSLNHKSHLSPSHLSRKIQHLSLLLPKNISMNLPQPSNNRIAIKLKPAAERQVKKGHPWIFEGSIVKQNTKGKAGDLAIIFDSKKNKFLACGLYDPASPIRIKLLQVHQSATINSDWFLQKIQAAFEIRKPLFKKKTNSYRLIYGESDGLPALVADVYDKVLVVKLYSSIWLPYFQDILGHLLEVSGCETAVLRLSRLLENATNLHGLYDGMVLFGDLENPIVSFKEHGLKFEANVIEGHKTGYFLDHRHNRRKVGLMAKGQTVLDVFSYAGGFSVHALTHGANVVTSLDISEQALELARRNVSLNPHKGKHKTMAMDAFEGMQILYNRKERFDIVVIDPPSFAKQESEIERAKHAYYRLAKWGTKLVNKGGTLVLASCSSRVNAEDFFAIHEVAIQEHYRKFKVLDKTYHDIDHPVNFPEGAYLKCGFYRVF